jgi:predicted AlkP superfamily phosphohydrolase/phosphomutase
MPTPRLLIIGLDCAEPGLVFERWHNELPHLKALSERAIYGRLESCIPAITVPAWSCMTSGRDPGELGIYGFRNRRNREYGPFSIADGRAVRVPRLWDIMSEAGWRVATVGVPGTYPPAAVNGQQIAGFLAPSVAAEYTHPPELSRRVAGWIAGISDQPYLLDVPNFRSADKARILRDIYTMCDQRFAVARGLLSEERPDLLMLVEMGVDRIHHAFWRYMDQTSPLYEPDSPFADAIRDYYRHVDQQIGTLVAACDDDSAILVVSDHGARPLMGGFAINEWLIRAGYLVLHERPVRPEALVAEMIDWRKTRVWGAGGYYGRIFLNVAGREPEGIVEPTQFEALRSELQQRLEAVCDPGGAAMGNRIFRPQQIYRRVRGYAPDLIVYFGDLSWRAIGQVGLEGLYTRENDTGPDDANHAQHGLYIWADPQRASQTQQRQDAQIYDILPSILDRYGLPAPEGLRGRIIV